MAKSRYIFASEKPRHGGRRFFLGVLVFILLFFGIVLAWNYVINSQVKYESVRVTVQNLPADLEGFTILHISDLQGKELGQEQSAVLRAVGSARVSCVVFTGDMIGESGNVQPFLDLVNGLPKQTTKFLITGDQDPSLTDGQAHASLSAYSDWVTLVQDAGVTILDEPMMMTRGKCNIWFVPEYLYSLDLDAMENVYTGQLQTLEDKEATADTAAQKRLLNYELERIEHIRAVRKTVSAKDIQITVAHAPLTSDYVTTMFTWQGKENIFSLRHASLILAGHYCAGGWRLPGKGAVWVPELGWWPADSLITGLGYVGGIPQYISPGLAWSGESPLPGRLFNQPAVTVIRLTSKLQ